MTRRSPGLAALVAGAVLWAASAEAQEVPAQQVPPEDAPLQAAPPAQAAPLRVAVPDAPAPAPTDWARAVRFDSGRDDSARRFRTAEACLDRPCVVTQNGAIRFHLQDRPVDITLWLVAEGRLTRVDYFETRSKADYLFWEQILNRRRNRLMWSITDRIQSGEIDTIHIYGVTRQYPMKAGDALIVEVERRDLPDDYRRYYFRYYQGGYRAHFDLGLILPINQLRVPEPDPPYTFNKINASATLQLARNRDPESENQFIDGLLAAVRPTAFLGFMGRKLSVDGDLRKTDTDMFGGVGVTLLEMLFVGWGTNLVRAPHTTAPFVGLHVRHAFGFVGELNRRAPAKWDEYLDMERQRRVIVVDEEAGPPPPR